MKIGIVPELMEAGELSGEVKAAVERAAVELERAGARITEVELPHARAAISAYYALGPCEAFSNLSRFDSIRYGHCEPGCPDLAGQYEASRAAGFGAEARRRIMLGSYLLSAGAYGKYYRPAQQIRTLITRDYEQAFATCDCLLAPVSPTAAFELGEERSPASSYLADMFTVPANIAGVGAMSVPAGLGEDTGMPVGVQLVSGQFRDCDMLRAAAALEQAFGQPGIAPAFS